MELFRALHHPYIYPVLDLELCNGHALTVLPFNARGSLKDLIYKVRKKLRKENHLFRVL
jgi:hypothetical protein